MLAPVLLLLACSAGLSVTNVIHVPSDPEELIVGGGPTVAKLPNPIPFENDASLQPFPQVRFLITEAIKWFETVSCLKFKKATKTDKLRIKFNMINDCYSKQFLTKTPQQSVVDVGVGCAVTQEDVIRELLHALGMAYEHCRSDRDKHLNVFFNRVHANAAGDFNMTSVPTPKQPYDYASVSHYDSWYKARVADRTPQTRTMVPKDQRYWYTPGSHRIQLGDIAGINRFYTCEKKCEKTTNKPKCLNGGIVNPNTCTDCVCAPFFSGKLCGKRHPGISAFNGKSCGAEFNATSVIENQAFYLKTPLSPPESTIRNSECYFFIQNSDAKKNIRFTMTVYRSTKENTEKYCNSGVQLYFDDDLHNPITLCSEEHFEKTGKTFDAKKRVIVRMFRVDKPGELESVSTYLGVTFKAV